MSVDATQRRRLAPQWQVGIAGVSAIAVSYGFARYGYGLFLPEIRRDFDLSISAVGLIGSATYVGYLAALTSVGLLATRIGPRPLVIAAGLSAAVGMTLVALAPGPTVLILGLVLAGMSSGWVWAPYSDVVDRMVPVDRRVRVVALLPAGTAFGVAVAGPLALLIHGSAWRTAWLLFGAVAVAATVYNARILPGKPSRSAADERHGTGLRWFARRSATPLFLTALSYGLIGSVYWTFAVEAITDDAQDTGRTAPLFWTLIGASGIAGLLTGAVIARLGERRTHAWLFALLGLAIALLGVAPGELTAVGASAVLYGPAFIAGSGVLAVWSYRVFPERPAQGLSGTVFFLGLGTIVGPAALGLVADHYDLRVAFLLTAAIAGLTLAARPPRDSPQVPLEEADRPSHRQRPVGVEGVPLTRVRPEPHVLAEPP